MKKIAIIFLLFTGGIFAQNKITYFPGKLLTQPFAANIIEPRIGFNFHFNDNLGLNIGNSLDIVRIKKGNVAYAFGADFFTFTRLRREKNFHFPVDAVDYLFGVNFSYFKKIQGDKAFGARIRFSHISAHFVDGHFDIALNKWRDSRNPIVYSREFIEVTPYYKINNLRFYSTIAYVFHIDPENIGKDYYQLGFDYYFQGLFHSRLINPFFAYDFKLVHLKKYFGNHSIFAGIKFGHANGEGFSLFLNYYSGKSFRGEYYNVTESYFAFGINLDL